ncbi:hypothetical protein GQ600_27868 [Phytophthora cactorum]|nr:hypothetical protein GQ600_27868 [Phytophthora cactorum]
MGTANNANYPHLACEPLPIARSIGSHRTQGIAAVYLQHVLLEHYAHQMADAIRAAHQVNFCRWAFNALLLVRASAYRGCILAAASKRFLLPSSKRRLAPKMHRFKRQKWRRHEKECNTLLRGADDYPSRAALAASERFWKLHDLVEAICQALRQRKQLTWG